MKDSGNSALKHGMSAREWLLVLLTAAALHALLFSLFAPMPRSFSESSSGRRYTLLLEERKLDLQRHDPYVLGYWLRFSDPELLLKPDPETGFSMFQGRNELTIPDPARLPFHLYDAVSFYRDPVPILPSERPIADFLSGPGVPVIPPLADRRIFPNVQYPLWTDETGRLSEGLFLSDEQSLRILKQQRASAPSVLLLRLQNDRIPSVRLLRSCGNPQLDRLAVRQLKIRKANFQPLPSAAPCVKYFTVSWQVPDMKSLPKEKMVP